MSTDAVAVIGFVSLFTLMLLRVPIGMALGLVGVTGFGYLTSMSPALKIVGHTTMRTVTDFNYAVVPLFLLMGSFATTSGMSRELFRAANAFIGHLRGGLGIATILACGGFAAICGSSVATAATFSRVAYPEMRRHNYPESFSAGVIAAGGTLGIMIPPSTVLAIYGIITEQDIGKLFIAGVIPGILAVIMYAGTVSIIGWWKPGFLPSGAKSTLERAGRKHQGRVGHAASVRVRDRRPLWRHVHGNRSRGCWRRRRLPHRRRAPAALRQADPAMPAGDHPDHGGRVHDPHRRAAVRLFPHHHPDPPEGHRIPDRARHRQLRCAEPDPVDVSATGLPDGRPCDRDPDRPDHLPTSSKRWDSTQSGSASSSS